MSYMSNMSSTTSSLLEPPFPASTTTSRSASPASRYEGPIIFAYGTNLWSSQIRHRCPSAKLLGVGRLRHWSWQINELGCANVVDVPGTPYDAKTVQWLGPLGAGRKESGERVYGLVWLLSEDDENVLDGFQDVTGGSYEKVWQWVELWTPSDGQTLGASGSKVDISRRAKRVKATFYVDKQHTTKSPGSMIPELAYKIRQGISDAVKFGVPEKYVDEVIRPYLPNTNEAEEQVKSAIRMAISQGIDVSALLKQVENELSETGAKKYKDQSANSGIVLQMPTRSIPQIGVNMEEDRGRVVTPATQ